MNVLCTTLLTQPVEQNFKKAQYLNVKYIVLEILLLLFILKTPYNFVEL